MKKRFFEVAAAIMLWCALTSLGAVTPPKADLHYLIIDRSGSIGSEGLKQPVAQAFAEYVEKMNAESDVYLVFFDSKASRVRRFGPMDSYEKVSLRDYFNKAFDPSGYTRLYDTVGEAVKDVSGMEGNYGTINLVILSDGEDNRSKKYRSWAAIDALAGPLFRDRERSFFTWYTLGYDATDVPATDSLFKHDPVSNPKAGFEIAIPAPSAAFEAYPRQVSVGETVLFTLLDQSGVSRLRWQFGDGATSTNPVAKHAYTRVGRYDVGVSVLGPGGHSDRMVPEAVEVFESVPLAADFVWSPDVVRVGEAVTLIDRSLGGPQEWLWHVQGAVREDRTPVVTFTSPGVKRVGLKISAKGESDQVVKSLTVVPSLPDPSFVTSPLSLKEGETLTLQSRQREAGARHEWVIDRDIVLEGAEAVWRANRVGRIDVEHRVTSSGGSASDWETIMVAPLAPVPEPAFKMEPANARVGERLQFVDESTGSPSSWIWTIDGTVYEERHPSVIFNTEGRKRVILTVANDRGEARVQRELEVQPAAPVAAFRVSPEAFVVGDSVTLSAQARSDDFTHTWVIDGDVKLEGAEAIWASDREGVLTVEHIVSGPGGESKASQSIVGTRFQLIQAAMGISDRKGPAPHTVQFKDQSEGDVVRWEWDFGDGFTSDIRAPRHEYKNPGKYYPRLTVINPDGKESKTDGTDVIIVRSPLPVWFPWVFGGLGLLAVWVVIIVPLLSMPAKRFSRLISVRTLDGGSHDFIEGQRGRFASMQTLLLPVVECRLGDGTRHTLPIEGSEALMIAAIKSKSGYAQLMALVALTVDGQNLDAGESVDILADTTTSVTEKESGATFEIIVMADETLLPDEIEDDEVEDDEIEEEKS